MLEFYRQIAEEEMMHPFNQKLQETAKSRREIIREMRDQGKTWVEIAKIFQITPQRAQQLGKKNGHNEAG